MFKPKNFEIYELVPDYIYKQYQFKSYLLWNAFDDRMLYTLDRLRKRYGKMIMNDWYWRKKDPLANRYRGWRDPKCEIGAIISQHKFWRAGDPVPMEVTAEEIRQDVLYSPFHEDFKYITCIEANVGWFHFDVRSREKEKDGILIIKP